MTKSPKDYLFVGIQLALFVGYAFTPQSLNFQLPGVIAYAGLFLAISGLCTCVLALLQLNVNLSPFPTPVSYGKLVTTGVFALARHPIYTGILLAAFGYAFYTGSGDKATVAALLLALFYFKSRYEEQLLSEKYAGYTDYKKRVGRFTPWF